MLEDSTPKGRQRMWWWVAGIAVVVIAVAAVTIGLAVRGEGPGPEAGSSEQPTNEETVPPIETDLPTPSPGATEPGDEIADVEIGLDETAEPEAGVEISVVSLEAVEGEPRGPGEIAGPAIRATVRIDNGTDEVLDLSRVAVNVLTGDDETPTNPVSGPGAEAFPASVEPGASATGSYVFTVPLADREVVRLILDLTASVASTVFVGSGPA